MGKTITGQSRAIIARIPDSNQKSLIFKNANRLHDTQHFISQQMPPSFTERRQFAMPEYQKLKSDPRSKAVLSQDKLYVKNKLQTQYQAPTLSVHPPSNTPPTEIKVSKDKKDSGSSFRGYSAEVNTINDVACVRQYLVANKPEVTNASHIIYAYRLESRGKITENFDSDRDWSTGHELLKMMRENNMTNTLCIATRMCHPGFSHIGKKRFAHINDLCLQAYQSNN